ncbi:4532_t:CDS:1, partial [Dentiscutata erythropus]
DKILYWQKYYSVDKSKYILGPVEIYYPQKKEKTARDNLKENPLESKDGIPS